MASEQSMTQAITQAVGEATKAAVMAVREAEGPFKSRRIVYTMLSKWASTETANI